MTTPPEVESKCRPILFQGAMVRALLAGTKTQTRRVATAAILEDGSEYRDVDGWPLTFRDPCEVRAGCPYGRAGDRLWVRESHWYFKDQHDPATGYFPEKPSRDDVIYRADGEVPGKVWRPSIHMPRWASRITLEITDVRVERLQAISDADAIAEGIETMPESDREMRPTGRTLGLVKPQGEPPGWGTPRQAYRALWESINGKGSWGANPWVWAITFRRIEGA